MRKIENIKTTLLLFTAIVLLMTIAVLMQRQPSVSPRANHVEKLNYLPSGTFLKGMALGYDEALADFLWVRTIGYFGSHVKTDQDYTWLIHMLQLITELDPRYESPYEFAGVILPAELEDVDTAITFLKKGIRDIPRHNPRYWLQPFYLGFCYFIYKDQPIQAAQYYQQAAAFPKSPSYLPLLIGRLYAAENRPQDGISVIYQMLDDKKSKMSSNSYTRDALIKRIKQLRVGMHLRLLQSAVDEYVQIYNKQPDQLADLVARLFLPMIPDEPFGGYYYISGLTGEVLSSKSEGKFILHSDRLKIKGR